jgi:hypothetical protein
MRKEVYNLEFPSWCQELTIFGYKFIRADDYEEKIASLQHLIVEHSEFEIHVNTGKHAVTACVEIPEHEEKTALAWADGSNATTLTDILLLLSIFTRRDVFAVDSAIDDGTGKVIIADPRFYDWGGVLITSLSRKNKPILNDEPNVCNIGFEEGLNQIYSLVRSEEWENRYERGYFLFLAQQAFRSRSLDIAFILCWVIWEHLSKILIRARLPEDRLLKKRARSKIAFLFIKYKIKDNITDKNESQIEEWENIRNELVHFGCFPQVNPEISVKHSSEYDSSYDDIISFIRFTEFIIAKILGLSPSHALNTKKMDEFLKG